MDLANRIRMFLNASSRLGKGFTLPGEDSKFSLRFKFDEGSPLESSFEETAALVRYATLLRPFMSSSSPVELRAFCECLAEDEVINTALLEFNLQLGRIEFIELPYDLVGDAPFALDIGNSALHELPSDLAAAIRIHGLPPVEV